MQSATRMVISASLIAGVLCAGTTYLTHDPRPLQQQAMEARDHGRLDRAERLMARQVQLDPTQSRDWYELGRLRAKLGKSAAALDDFKTAARLQGEALADTQRRMRGQRVEYYNLACYRALAGDKTGALDALERSVKLGYTDTGHMTTDEDLDTLRSDPRYIAAMALAEQKNIDRMSAPGEGSDRQRSQPSGRPFRAD